MLLCFESRMPCLHILLVCPDIHCLCPEILLACRERINRTQPGHNRNQFERAFISGSFQSDSKMSEFRTYYLGYLASDWGHTIYRVLYSLSDNYKQIIGINTTSSEM
jgi:hypothetical protein